MAREDVRVLITGDNRQLKSALGSSNKQIQSFSRQAGVSLKSVTTSFRGLASSFLPVNAGLAAVAGAAGLGLLIERSLEAADAIGKTADRVGLTVEGLQELRFAAQQSGVATSTFDMAMQRFSRRVGEAANGSGELRDTLKQYGIAVRDSEGRSRALESVLNDYADAIAKAGNNQERLRLAFKAFDSEGAALVNLFRKGSAGVRELRQEARDLGLVMTSQMVRSAERANDELAKIGGVLRTQVTKAVLQLTPQILELAKAFRQNLLPALTATFNFFGSTAFDSLDTLEEKLTKAKAALAEAQEAASRLNAGSFIPNPFQFLGLSDDDNATQRVKVLQNEVANLTRAIEQRRRTQALLNVTTDETAASDLKATNTLRGLRSELQFEIDQLGRSKAEQRLYALAKREGMEVNDRFRASLEPLVSKLTEEQAAIRAAMEAEKERAQQQAELAEMGRSVFEATRTPQEQFQSRMQELNKLVEQGAIDWQTYGRAVDQAQKRLDQSTQSADNFGVSARGLGSSLSSAFANAAVSGESLSGVMEGLIKDLIRATLQAIIFRAVMSAFGLGGGGGGGFGSFALAFAQDGAAFDRQGTRFLASGGVLHSPTLFRERGGLAVAGEAGPEAVLPLRRNSAGKLGVMAGGAGGSPVVINIHNTTGQEARTEQSEGPDGTQIDVFFDETVARNVTQPGTKTNQALRNTFGLGPSRIGR